MTHETMRGGDDDGHGCFVPWCTCACHHPGSIAQDHAKRSEGDER